MRGKHGITLLRDAVTSIVVSRKSPHPETSTIIADCNGAKVAQKDWMK